MNDYINIWSMLYLIYLLENNIVITCIKKSLLWYSSFQTSEYKVFQEQLNNKDVFALSLLLVALYETCLYCQTYILKILF